MFLYEKNSCCCSSPGAIFGACSDRAAHPALVTGVVMPPESRVFTPGDGVTVSAEGFEADDENHVRNPLGGGRRGFALNGCAKRRAGDRHGALRRERHLSGPGALPCFDGHGAAVPPGASVPLGKIRVADGVPESEALYGISDSDTDGAAIDRIDLRRAK